MVVTNLYQGTYSIDMPTYLHGWIKENLTILIIKYNYNNILLYYIFIIHFFLLFYYFIYSLHMFSQPYYLPIYSSTYLHNFLQPYYLLIYSSTYV